MADTEAVDVVLSVSSEKDRHNANGKERRLTRWHDKVLPDSMVKLHSKEGQYLLKHCTVRSSITDYAIDQSNRRYCGPQSLAVCINYLRLGSQILRGKYGLNAGQNSVGGIPTWGKASSDYIEFDTIVDENDLRFHPSSKADFDGIDKNGVPLHQLWQACTSLGIKAEIYYVENRKRTKLYINGIPLNVTQERKIINGAFRLHDEKEFRNLLVTVLKDPNSCIIVNYYMGSLGYTGLRGHFSPIGAYDATSDSCLVLDVWPETPVAWVKLSSLFAAMATLDESSGLNRGCIRLSKPYGEEMSTLWLVTDETSAPKHTTNGI